MATKVAVRVAKVTVLATMVIFASALPGRADPGVTGSVEFARPIGDTYNERTTDGDAYRSRSVFERCSHAVTSPDGSTIDAMCT